MLAAQWSIKSNPTSLTKTQIVNFEDFNNAMPEFSEINKKQQESYSKNSTISVHVIGNTGI